MQSNKDILKTNRKATSKESNSKEFLYKPLITENNRNNGTGI